VQEPEPPLCGYRADIDFRLLAESDLEALHQWLNELEVRRWYGPDAMSLAQVRDKYMPRILGEAPTLVYVIEVDESDIGIIQKYRVADHPEWAAMIEAKPGWVGIDYFIGSPEFRGRGIGAAAIERFVVDVVFADPQTKACVSAPSTSNTRSIRCLEKVGFVFEKVVIPGGGEEETLLIRTRA